MAFSACTITITSDGGGNITGRTDIANMIPLCEKHHHLVHEGGWTLTDDPRPGHHLDPTRRHRSPTTDHRPTAPPPASGHVERTGHKVDSGRPTGAAASGGRDRRRSGDPTLFRRVLCQLSYSTVPSRVLATRPISQKSHSPSFDDKWPPAAVPTGLEPATSGLTGRRELQTSPRDHMYDACAPHPQRDSNPCRHLERVVS